jgi:hypothetical protein
MTTNVQNIQVEEVNDIWDKAKKGTNVIAGKIIGI